MAISPEKQEQLHKERRKQIIDSAYYLFFSKGYKNTSMADIAAESGISKGLIYRYFKNKEDMLLAHREETFQCLESYRADPSPKNALKRYLDISFSTHGKGDYIGQIYVLFEAILEGDIATEEYNEDMVHRYGIDFFSPIFKRGQELGELKEGDPEQMADIFWHIILGYCFRRTPTEISPFPADLADNVLAFFTR